MDTRHAIAARLEAMGKSPYWLAGQCGLDRSTVKRYLAGVTDTGTEKADLMLKAVGLSVDTEGTSNRRDPT